MEMSPYPQKNCCANFNAWVRLDHWNQMQEKLFLLTKGFRVDRTPYVLKKKAHSNFKVNDLRKS